MITSRTTAIWRHTFVLTLVPLLLTIAGVTFSNAQGVDVRIYNYYSPSRVDNFATTNPSWAGNIGDVKEGSDYRLHRIEGRMFNPDRPQPDGTVPVYSWYNPSRGDNFMTSDPRWRGAPGDTRSPDYLFVRMEGYAFDPFMPPPQGAIPLYSWYDGSRGDNFATTNRVYAGVSGVSGRPPNYRYVRREGYVLPYHPRPDLASIILPVYFHFQEAFTDWTTGLPAYGAMDAPETMLDIDEAVTRLNDMLNVARGMDSRRITFARAGVKYVAAPTEDSERTTPIYHWWSNGRKDNFATTDNSWQIQSIENERRSPDYRPAGKLAALYRPDRPQPPGTIPVYSWYSPSRGDNFMTSDPTWSAVPGDTKSPDYRFVRIEGYIYDPARPKPPNTLELNSWYSPGRADNFITSDHLWRGARSDERDGYRFVRKEGYAMTPAGCDLVGTRLAANLLPQAINVLVTNDCRGEAISANMIRSHAGALPHEIGHAMGQYHMFEGNRDLATVEHLYRELDPNNPDSCYRRGDRVCDTPPDYGFAAEDGTEDPQCDNPDSVPISCRQTGPACDPQEPMVDGADLCTMRGGQGERRYEAVALGLQLGTPNNVMAYHNQEEFSYEQFLRILNYGLWRAGLKEQVPSDERHVFKDFSGGPPADRIWSETPGSDHALAYAQQVDIRMTPSGTGWRSLVTPSVGTRLLDFRIEITGAGRASNEAFFIVRFPDGSTQSFRGDDLFREYGRVVFDELYGRDIAALRGKRPGGDWTVELRGAGSFAPDRARLWVLAQ